MELVTRLEAALADPATDARSLWEVCRCRPARHVGHVMGDAVGGGVLSLEVALAVESQCDYSVKPV